MSVDSSSSSSSRSDSEGVGNEGGGGGGGGGGLWKNGSDGRDGSAGLISFSTASVK